MQLPTPEIRFDDGAAYEHYMGIWSRQAGEQFLQWLEAPPGLRWLDVGCGNGAFTELLAQRCQPAALHGIDPSEPQLAYARSRLPPQVASFSQADAMALPFTPHSFDAAVMPLVIFFVPQPALGVAEMARVVRSGGVVSAYAWDLPGGGFPYHALQTEMRAMGMAVPAPPSADVSRTEALQALWEAAGLQQVQTCQIRVQRSFAGFEAYWATVLCAPSVGERLSQLTPADAAALQDRLRHALPVDAEGRIHCSAVANAVRGRKP